MALAKLSRKVEKRVRAEGGAMTSNRYEGFSDWWPLFGFDAIRVGLDRRATQILGGGSAVVKVAIQAAEVRPDAPIAWATLGNYSLTTDGEDCSDALSLDSYKDAYMFFRIGAAFASDNAGTTLIETCLTLQVQGFSTGELVGGRTVEVMATTTDDRYEAVTEWIPASQAEKVMVAWIMAQRSGNLEAQPAYQTAEIVTSAPDAWANVPSSQAKTANGEWNTGGQSLPISGKMWVRFGLRYRSTNGTGSAVLTAVVATRK
jgi:hypothetical protein